MKKLYLFLFINLASQMGMAQMTESSENQREFDHFVEQLEKDFIYYDKKKVIVDCIKQTYRPHVDTISHPYYKVLFYENLLNELYDSHINLNTNTDRSYRLNAPVYVGVKNNRFYLKNIFSSQLAYPLKAEVLNAEVLSFNQLSFQEAI
ncbi:MAG: hypothetical protein AAFY41_19900, partial [Bacteroidota bacterium]